MPLHIVIIKVKARYTIITLFMLTFLNNVTFNCRFADFTCGTLVPKEIHPLSNFVCIKVGVYIRQIVNPCRIFNDSHLYLFLQWRYLMTLNTSAFLAKYSMPE